MNKIVGIRCACGEEPTNALAVEDTETLPRRADGQRGWFLVNKNGVAVEATLGKPHIPENSPLSKGTNEYACSFGCFTTLMARRYVPMSTANPLD